MGQTFISTGTDDAEYVRQGKYALWLWFSTIGGILASIFVQPAIISISIMTGPLALYGSSKWLIGKFTYKEPYSKIIATETTLELHQLSSEVNTTIQWNDIKTIYEQINAEQLVGGQVRLNITYDIITTDDMSYTITDQIANVQQLGQIIKQQVQNRLFQEYVNRFNSGETIQFDDLSISKEGIYNAKNKFKAWQDVPRLIVSNRQVIIRNANGIGYWLNYNLNGIPNPDIFVSLLKPFIYVPDDSVQA